LMKLQVEELIKVSTWSCIFEAVDSHGHQPRARDNELDRRVSSSVMYEGKTLEKKTLPLATSPI